MTLCCDLLICIFYTAVPQVFMMPRKRSVKMDKNLKVSLLKKGGKKALAEYNRMNRGLIAQMNTGTRVHTDQRKKKPKHKNRIFEEM